MAEVNAVLAHRSIPRTETGAAIFRGKAFKKPLIWMEFFFAAVELPHVA